MTRVKNSGRGGAREWAIGTEVVTCVGL